MEQLSINFAPEPATDDQVQLLKRIILENARLHSLSAGGEGQGEVDPRSPSRWMTRKAISAALDWSERTIRNVAEAAGADIVRGPLGFTVFESATNAEVEHAAHISQSQGEKMQQYGTALLKRLAQRTA
jgi:hypothetical protein